MSLHVVQFVIAAFFIVCGILIMICQTIGIFRFRYVLNRMHAAAMGDSLGLMLIMEGLIVVFGFSFASLKLIAVVVLYWFASPTCAHLLSKLEVSTNENLENDCEVPDK